MSAQIDAMPRMRRMRREDLDAVVAIEQAVYTHPWTLGNFADSLDAGYHCWIMESGGLMIGYAVMMIAAEEAHLLNLSIAADWQRRGYGSVLLRHVFVIAREGRAHTIYLEVRESNAAGRALYGKNGFAEIGARRDYYPRAGGREDAVSMEKKLP